ncbi:MAG: hypothetical protein AAFY70_15125, partial [Bacteroidota bacterium]
YKQAVYELSFIHTYSKCRLDVSVYLSIHCFTLVFAVSVFIPNEKTNTASPYGSPAMIFRLKKEEANHEFRMGLFRLMRSTI